MELDHEKKPYAKRTAFDCLHSPIKNRSKAMEKLHPYAGITQIRLTVGGRVLHPLSLAPSKLPCFM